MKSPVQDAADPHPRESRSLPGCKWTPIHLSRPVCRETQSPPGLLEQWLPNLIKQSNPQAPCQGASFRKPGARNLLTFHKHFYSIGSPGSPEVDILGWFFRDSAPHPAAGPPLPTQASWNCAAGTALDRPALCFPSCVALGTPLHFSQPKLLAWPASREEKMTMKKICVP